MSPQLMVETTWILDVALQQDSDALDLWTYAEAGLVKLFVPSFCLAEAIKRFEQMRKIWTSEQDGLKKREREMSRSGHLGFACATLNAAEVVLAQAADQAEVEFWRALQRIAEVVTLLHPRASTLGETRDLRDQLKLTPADAAVVATVVEANRDGACASFFSKDKDLQEAITEYLAGQGITLLTGLGPVLGPIRQAGPAGAG